MEEFHPPALTSSILALGPTRNIVRRRGTVNVPDGFSTTHLQNLLNRINSLYNYIIMKKLLTYCGKLVCKIKN